MPLTALLLAILASSGAASDKGKPPRLVGNSSYVSATANKFNVRNRIDVIGTNHIVRAVGRHPNTGAGEHSGGALWVVENERSYTIRGIGIELPKEGVTDWSTALAQCQRLDMSDDVFTTVCTQTDRVLSSVVSRSRGVLSFTGWCPVMFVGGGKETCQYVLISERGLAAH